VGSCQHGGADPHRTTLTFVPPKDTEDAVVDLRDLREIAGGLDHPEGVATGPDGLLYAGGEAGQIYRLDERTQRAEEIANTGGFALGLCLDAAGSVYVCDAAARAILRVSPATRAIEVYCDSAGGKPLETPNWPAFAPDGSLYFTDSGTESLEVVNGRLIRIPPGGGEGIVQEVGPLHFPNGMCVAADGTPYVLETLRPRLSAVRDGRLELVAELPGHSPDGVALCADGGFLIACYYPFRLLYVPAGGGGFEIVLDDPTGIHIPMPTNVTFFGPRLASVAIASLGGYSVKGIELGIEGAPTAYPYPSPNESSTVTGG
jgi:gluconolactonase